MHRAPTDKVGYCLSRWHPRLWILGSLIDLMDDPILYIHIAAPRLTLSNCPQQLQR